MSDTPCAKQLWSPALCFHGDLIWFMAETCRGIIPTCQCQEALKSVLQWPTRNGQSMWTELSFLGQTFWSLWLFHNFLGIRTTNLICQIIDFQGTWDLCCYCVLWLGPKLGLVVRKHLASLGVDSSEARWSSKSKSISEVKGYSDWKCNGLLPLVILVFSGLEAFQWLLSQLLRYSFGGICGNEMEGLALITWRQKSLFPHWPALHHLFYYHLYRCGDGWKEYLGFMFIAVLLWSGIYSGSCTGTQVTNVSLSGLSLGAIPEGYSDCTLGDIRGNQGFNGEELDISLGCHQVYPWYISTLPQW